MRQVARSVLIVSRPAIGELIPRARRATIGATERLPALSAITASIVHRQRLPPSVCLARGVAGRVAVPAPRAVVARAAFDGVGSQDVQRQRVLHLIPVPHRMFRTPMFELVPVSNCGPSLRPAPVVPAARRRSVVARGVRPAPSPRRRPAHVQARRSRSPSVAGATVGAAGVAGCSASDAGHRHDRASRRRSSRAVLRRRWSGGHRPPRGRRAAERSFVGPVVLQGRPPPS